ncbi:hypothetical protein ACQP04_03010 [Pseudonocardia halophobica]|uniref:hypothetical protein n=1 Tax=Pseudonocardia halophobica TaxID=29401 RepID=UPI003D8EA397
MSDDPGAAAFSGVLRAIEHRYLGRIPRAFRGMAAPSTDAELREFGKALAEAARLATHRGR